MFVIALLKAADTEEAKLATFYHLHPHRTEIKVRCGLFNAGGGDAPAIEVFRNFQEGRAKYLC
jgi:hypothetical protein